MNKGDDRETKKMTEMKNKIRRKMTEMKKERTRKMAYMHCYPVSSQPVLNLTLALSWV